MAANFLQAPQWQGLFTELFGLPFTLRYFKANFGVSPAVCCHLWRVVLDHSEAHPRPRNLLVFLCFLKTHETYDSLATKFRITEKSVRNMVEQMAALMENLDVVGFFYFWFFFFLLFFTSPLLFLVCFPLSLPPPPPQIHLADMHLCPPLTLGTHRIRLVLDCTVCPVEPPLGWEKQKVYYSGKHRLHCLKYECAVRPDGLIVWVNGAYYGSKHDLNVFRTGGLADQVGNQRILADKGYVGEEIFIHPIKGRDLDERQSAFNALISRQRVVVENTFSMVKHFRAMSTPWRANRETHGVFFGFYFFSFLFFFFFFFSFFFLLLL